MTGTLDSLFEKQMKDHIWEVSKKGRFLTPIFFFVYFLSDYLLMPSKIFYCVIIRGITIILLALLLNYLYYKKKHINEIGVAVYSIAAICISTLAMLKPEVRLVYYVGVCIVVLGFSSFLSWRNKYNVYSIIIMMVYYYVSNYLAYIFVDGYKWSSREIFLITSYYPLLLTIVSAISIILNKIRFNAFKNEILQKELNKEIIEFNSISNYVNNTLELDEVFDRVFEYLKFKFRFEGAWLCLVNEDKRTFRFELFTEPEHVAEKSSQFFQKNYPLYDKNLGGQTAVCIRKNVVLYYTNVYENKKKEKYDISKTIIDLLKFDSIILLPISVDGEVIGCISFHTFDKTLRLSGYDLETIHRFVNQISIAIKNSNMYNKVIETSKELKKTSDALWGEMKTAEMIQTMLLPLKPNVPGYDILPYTKPAVKVAGDYYDVINVEDAGNWIIIGDVSGHGVPAGLVMIMVQTAIHTTLDQYPYVNPAQLLERINKTIYDNLDYITNIKYYMTITVLKEEKCGYFTHAGYHQDIIIYRSKTKEIELVKTTGMWLGIKRDVTDVFEDNELKLEDDDIMLLYTDGIIESYKNYDDRDNLFGIEKLCGLLKDNAHKPLKQIMVEMLNEVSSYVCEDDVTLMLVKKEMLLTNKQC